MTGQIFPGGVQTEPALCGDPRLPIATPMCCSSGWESTEETGKIFCTYQGERMTYASAQNACGAYGMESCQPGVFKENLGGECAYGSAGGSFRNWAAVGCQLKAKIDLSSGDVAIVVSNNSYLIRVFILS